MKRVTKLKKQFNKLGIKAMFVSNPQNIQYLSGVKCVIYDLVQKIGDPEVFLLITEKRNFVVADPRHAGALQNVPEFEFAALPYPTNPTNLADFIRRQSGARVIGVEEDSFLYKDLSELKSVFKGKLVDVSGVISEMRLIKDADEIKLLEKAAEITSDGFEYALSKLRQGMTEKELAFEITSFFLKNAEGNSFDPIVAFGEGSAVPHYETSDKKIEGDGILLIDLGCKFEGYCGDMTRTVFVGKAPKKFKDRYSAVLKAQENCLKKLKSGMTGKQGDALARDSFGNLAESFSHGTGHGVGLAVHEEPRLNKTSSTKLKDGMVFSVEPGIYIPGWGGIRIEDIVYLSDGRPVNITKTPKNLREITLK